MITLNSIIRNSKEVYVISHSGEKIRASVLGSDRIGNINVLKIDRSYTSSIPMIIQAESINPGTAVILIGIVKGNILTANSPIKITFFEEHFSLSDLRSISADCFAASSLVGL